MPSAARATRLSSPSGSSLFVSRRHAQKRRAHPEYEDDMETNTVKDVVREKYGQAALRAGAGARSSCCGSAAGSDLCCDPITSDLYEATQAGEVPDLAMRASLGCGNPTALAELKPGEVVLDLGSGGGIDVLLSARRVGPTGKAYGL